MKNSLKLSRLEESLSGKGKKLTAEFFKRPAEKVARDLLGKKLVRVIDGKRVSGIIVETEAYIGAHDDACHAAGGIRSARTETLYMDGGHVYVYLIYGMYWCLNFVTGPKDHPEAVLIRAIEPSENIETMRKLRWKKVSGSGALKKKDTDLTSGPGKLCSALKIDKSHNTLSVKNDELFVEDTGLVFSPRQIVKSPRIGVDYAGDAAHWDLRFYIKDNPFVSKPR